LSRYNLLKGFLLVLVFLSWGMAAEYAPADFGVTVDVSRFSIKDGIYLDVYLMVPRASFTFVPEGEKLKADVMFQAALLQGDQVMYGPDRWMRTYRVASEAEAAGHQQIPDISKFYALPGEYTLLVDVLDVATNRRQRIKKPVELALHEEELITSDITIASVIQKAAAENEFTKYGYDIVPNAGATFSLDSPMFYYFFEIYNLSGQGKYKLHSEVRSLGGAKVQDFGLKEKDMPGASAVEWGGFNTSGLKSGIYQFFIKVEDGQTGQQTEKSRKFYVYRAGSEEASLAVEDEYSSLEVEQLDEIYRLVSMVMTAEEKRLYESSEASGKGRILSTFWSRRDPDPTTRENEYKRDFYERVQIANRDFQSRGRLGWETDRGRVLIRYGKPDNIEQAPSALDARPWERWEYYDYEGGVEFIFVDKSGFGEYELVHSTARNEVSDEAWERWLR